MTRFHLAFALALAGRLSAQSTRPTLLPAPTGPLAVGRISYDWVDSSRAAFLDAS